MTEFTRKLCFQAMNTGAPIRFVHSFTSDPGEKHHLHINNYIEIYIYISGAVDYVVEDHFYPLESGDIIVITPHEVHKAVIHGQTEYERFYFLVPTDVAAVFPSPALREYAAVKRRVPTRIRLPEAERTEMRTLLNRLSALCGGEEDYSSALMCHGIFLQFLSLLLRQAERTESRADAGDFPVNPLIRDVLVYVDQHLPQLQTVQEVAAHFHVSVPYLSHLFSHSIGTPLKSYIQIKKIALAKQLLDSGKSVTYACYESGFSDCSYFIRIFRRHIGVTPFRYRNTRPDSAPETTQTS
mgnify:CR=1 FL=1